MYRQICLCVHGYLHVGEVFTSLWWRPPECPQWRKGILAPHYINFNCKLNITYFVVLTCGFLVAIWSLSIVFDVAICWFWGSSKGYIVSKTVSFSYLLNIYIYCAWSLSLFSNCFLFDKFTVKLLKTYQNAWSFYNWFVLFY